MTFTKRIQYPQSDGVPSQLDDSENDQGRCCSRGMGRQKGPDDEKTEKCLGNRIYVMLVMATLECTTLNTML